ncbi:unnamed protein product [Euphydryas editha]|uniref:CCHC-type domain-containing protein n=1 Tax=Euphydryas editha TaxID=104508 RepID=A0AAU9UZG7_EUPED|nr:unnamed protein product [Euphydryas editha]
MSRGYVRDRGSCLNRPDREEENLYKKISPNPKRRRSARGCMADGWISLDCDPRPGTGRHPRRVTLGLPRQDEACTEAEKAILEQAKVAEEGRRAMGVITGDSLAEEVRRLQAENSRLRRDLEDLRRQVVELREQNSSNAAPTCLPRREEGLAEEVSASVIRSVGRMIDARFAGLEDRLQPAKTLRPPLAADRRKEKTTQKAPSSSAKPAPVRRRRPHASEELAPAVEAGDGEWTTVAKRKRKKAPKSYAAAAAAATPAPKGPQPQPPAKKKKKAKKPKLAAPRSPAVPVTLDEYAESKGITYCHLLKRAADTIDLAELGIVGGLKLRRAATGARLLELPKGQTPEVAGRLAEAMQEALGSLAKVVQPMKLAGVRISGLDDSVSCEMVAAAVAKVGRCDAGAIKTGAITVGPGGLGCTVVRCPIPAAKALAEAGRLLVGWTSARVQVLEQRPMRCFKCLGIGHTRPTCPAAVDRSGACFRCGLEGHIARNCTGALHCAVCAAAGKPASHLMGGRDCRPPKSRGRAAAKTPAAPQSPILQDTEETAAMSS